MARVQRLSDYRLRDLVRDTGNGTIATKLGVPRSTAAGWHKRMGGKVVAAEPLSIREKELQAEVVRLRRPAQAFRAVVRLRVALMRALGIDLDRQRLPDGEAKSGLLREIDRALPNLELRRVLRILGLSPSRYPSWRRSELRCELADVVSCPLSSPHRLTRDETARVREMVESSEFRHVRVGMLAILAPRLGKLYASASTWQRAIRVHAWRRPRLRIHPAKPKVGDRAARPDEMWHIDTTILRRVDGTKATIHAVIDNSSRRILGWQAAGSFDPSSTVAVLLDATRARSRSRTKRVPTVLADGGVEIVEKNVDARIESGLLRRVLAMTKLKSSNSMNVPWWRALKHNGLFLNTRDSVESVMDLDAHYLEEHDSRLPRSAFRRQRPDEMSFGMGDQVPAELERARAIAKRARFEENRAATCGRCE